MTTRTSFQIPAQHIPPPQSLSFQAQEWLAAAAQRVVKTSDTEGKQVGELALTGAEAALNFLRPMAAGFDGTVESIGLPTGATLYRVTPDGRQGRAAEVAYFDVHGGGFVAGGGEMCQLLAKLRAREYGVEVFAVDYRLFPEYPAPAALNDCLHAYRIALTHYPATAVVVAGASAGGNLAAGMLLRARDEALPLPAALLLLTPVVDLTLSGDSHQTNRFLDANLYGGADFLPTYAGQENISAPHISPLFGDFAQGWPPTLLASGTRDLLLSDTVRMHRALRRAGIHAELHISEASPHGGFMGAGAPEDLEIVAECRRFAVSAWGLDA